MVRVNGILLVLSSIVLAGIAAPAVHERQVDCASESHPAAEHVVLDHAQEEDSALEERQHVQEDAVHKVVNAQMEAEWEEEVSHLEVHQSAKAAAQETEDISTVAKSGAAAVNKIMNYLENSAMDAAVLDRSVNAVTRRLTIPQALVLQRQFASLSLVLSQGTRVIRSARSLTSIESRQLFGAIRGFENNFMNLLATTIAKKTTFERLPYNIMPRIESSLRNLGSMTDGFEAAMEGVVAPSAKQTVTSSRKTLARAFARAYMTYD